MLPVCPPTHTLFYLSLVFLWPAPSFPVVFLLFSLLAMRSTIIYFIHFFFISESFNYLIFSLQNLFPYWSFFVCLFPVFSFILLIFSWIWLSFPSLWLTWMEFIFACVPFQVTGDFYISTLEIFTQHLTYVSVLTLNRVTEEFDSSEAVMLPCFSHVSCVPVLCFVHLLVCLPSSFIWGSS